MSSGGGWEPIWSRDGGELFYRSLDGNRIFSAKITASHALSVGRPTLVLEGKHLQGSPYGKTYDVSPDGQRFLVQVGAEPLPPVDHYNVILNWFDELKQRVPSPR